MRKMSRRPLLAFPSRELSVQPATKALPLASTCANWPAGLCTAPQMRVELERNPRHRPVNEAKDCKKVKPRLKDDTKLTTACPTVSGQNQFNSHTVSTPTRAVLNFTPFRNSTNVLVLSASSAHLPCLFVQTYALNRSQ